MMLSDVCLSDVCRVHREYSCRPQLLEARRAERRCRPGVYGLELDRSMRCVPGRGISWRPPAYSLFISQKVNKTATNLVYNRQKSKFGRIDCALHGVPVYADELYGNGEVQSSVDRMIPT